MIRQDFTFGFFGYKNATFRILPNLFMGKTRVIMNGYEFRKRLILGNGL